MTSTIRTTVLILTGVIAMLLISSTYRDPEPATKIGGTKVPAGLVCQEDEVIGFDMSGEVIPAPLMCIHIDDLRGVAPHVECDAFETTVTICVDGDGETLSRDAAAQGREEDAYDMGFEDGLAAARG